MKYSIVTFGCRVNHADSLRIEEDLRARGATEAPSSVADLVVVNTCSVTATADQGARQTIRRIARENPSARIVATGCYATRCEDEVAGLPNVLRVVRNNDKPHFLDSFLRMSDLEPRTADLDGPCGQPIEPGIAGRTAFTIRAQTGCEEQCAYCIIPTTRGASRSLPIQALVAEVERVADAGFKEVVVTGVHLGSYGRDLAPAASLLMLMRALDAVRRDVTFRISSLEPMDCTPDVVDFVTRSGRFQPHFHLPLQHASDRMLAAMRRPYTLANYRALVDGIIARLPHASIGSDMIVGFPGETEDDFAANLEYLPSSPLTHLHVFPYSDRPGTAATSMPTKVHGSIIRERGVRLRDIGASLARRFRDSQIGSVRSGLTLEDGTLVVTDNYLKVRVKSGRHRNERVMVRLLPAESELSGEIVATPKQASSSPGAGPAISVAWIP